MSLRNDIIRLAYNNPKHREELLGLVLASEKEAEEKEAKFEKGKKVDVGDWLKANGHADAAAAWEKHEGEIGKKAGMGGKKIFLELVDMKKLYGARKMLKDQGDTVTEALMRPIMEKFIQELEPSNPRVFTALTRLRNAIARPGPGLGNQIYKVADELGIK